MKPLERTSLPSFLSTTSVKTTEYIILGFVHVKLLFVGFRILTQKSNFFK